MIFGIGEESKYALIAVAVIYLVLINTVAGARNIATASTSTWARTSTPVDG